MLALERRPPMVLVRQRIPMVILEVKGCIEVTVKLSSGVLFIAYSVPGAASASG